MGVPRDALVRAVRGKKPPPYVYAPNVVPGYGQYIHEKAARKMGQVNAAYDHVENSLKQRNAGPPLQRVPTSPRKKLRPEGRRNRGTRPNPGSATNHRPTLD